MTKSKIRFYAPSGEYEGENKVRKRRAAAAEALIVTALHPGMHLKFLEKTQDSNYGLTWTGHHCI